MPRPVPSAFSRMRGLSRRLRLSVALPSALLALLAGQPLAAQSTGDVRTPVPQVASRADANGVRVDAALSRDLVGGQRRDFAIELRERADLSGAAGLDWAARGEFVVSRLRDTADRSQANLRRQLDRSGVDYEAHWIKNVILVRDGDAAALRLASAQPGIARIRDLPQTQLIRPEPGSAAKTQAKAGVADNISWIGADQVWTQGTRGHGVTVGVIDSSVRHTHDVLRRQYRGWRGGGFEHDYNWFQPSGHSPEPVNDGNAHGSHVTGTITGDDHAADPAQRQRLGVAPGAQWIACQGFPFDGDPSFSLLSCGEFMLAPTRTDGTDPRPELRPQVVNNSWSEGNCNGETTSFYSDVVDAWVASGIFPVFAAGNASTCFFPEPAGLSTVSSPASLAAAFAVGSSGNHDGAYAAHSLWGPTTAVSPGLPVLPDPRGFPQLKPQVVAPGVNILSAYDTGDDVYGTMTGTSMSSPHISGLVALMLDAGDCLVGDYPRIGALIMQTARPMPYASGGDPAPGPGDVPNYATGWGEIDVPAAVDAASDACGPQGFIAGRVTDANGQPVAGATVELYVDAAVRIHTLTTESDGSYIRRVPENITQGYTVRVSAYGYLPAQESGVPVRNDETTSFDAQLAIAPRYKVAGQVRDAATGWPLHARVRIAGAPVNTLWTDAGTGRYAITLPAGTPYRLSVDSDIAGYVAQHRDLPALGAASEQDFALAADVITCAAPGYGFAQQMLSEDFENALGTPPAGWNTTSAGIGWKFGNLDEVLTPDWRMPPRDGRFAATVDPFPADGEPSNDGSQDALTSPPITLTGTTPVLRYASRYFTWYGVGGPGSAQVQVSGDNGATWSSAGTPPNQDEWSDEAVDLSAWAGQTVRLRFHYDDGSALEPEITNPGWAIDDVRVVASCVPPANGGLIVGHVRDANTGLGLDGAHMQIDNGPRLVTATSADPNLGAGVFVGHAAQGSAAVHASGGSNPAGYHDADATVSIVNGSTNGATLALPAGRLRLHPPAGPAATLQLGTTASVPFSLRNTGSAPLTFALEGQHREEHFDAGLVPPDGWQMIDNGIGCQWTTNLMSNHTGDGVAAEVYLYPCWDGARVDTSLLLPPVDLSNSDSGSIGFFLYLGNGADVDARFDIEASTDAGSTWTSVFTHTRMMLDMEPALLVEQDLSQFAGIADLRLRLRYQGTPPWGWVQFDQLHVFRSLGEDGELSAAPSTGTLAPGASLDTSALFDATAIAQPGIYSIPIRIGEDTPYTFPYGDTRGTMTVTAPPSYGSVSGTLRSLGRCDTLPSTLAGIDLSIVDALGGEYVATTDDDGHYRYWIDAARGPVTVTAQVDGHVATQRNATLAAGTNAVADIDLRPTLPCLAADPASLDATLPAGGSITVPLDLVNLGPVAGDYTARIGGDPNIPTAQRISQNLAPDPEQYASFSCVYGDFSMENHFYRVFPLEEQGIAGASLLVDSVRFGADSATSSIGTQPVQIRLYTLTGDFVLANLQLLSDTTVDVPDSPLQILNAAFDPPITVPTNAILVAEIAHADGRSDGRTFFPAGNTGGATAQAWGRAEGCGQTEPVPYTEMGLGHVATIIELDVRASDACGNTATPVSWLGVSPASGTITGDGETTLDVAFAAAALPQGVHNAALCIGGPTVHGNGSVIPVRLGVDAPIADAIFTDDFE